VEVFMGFAIRQADLNPISNEWALLRSGFPLPLGQPSPASIIIMLMLKKT
jgi:hypothetical protein